MSLKKQSVTVEIPHRISGFFEIVDETYGVKIKKPENIGSRGAGFNLNSFGKTKIILEEFENLDSSSCQIYINNEELNQKAETSYYIFNYILKYMNNHIKVKIFHTFDLPVGCGYGASGSGALGTIFGLDKILNIELSFHEKVRIAHISEVINKTGLGTVCGQLGGGLCILKEPGFPCVYERIKIPQNIKIICGSFGMIQTKSILTDPILSLKIKKAGKNALRKLLAKPNIKTFIDVSLEFVKNSNITTILDLKIIPKLIEDLNKLEIIGASMNQLGRSVYVICEQKDEYRVTEVLDCYKPKIKIFDTSINEKKGIMNYT